MTRDVLLAIATAPKRNSLHWKNGSTTWGSILDWMATPDDHKEAGNYLLGTLRQTTRTHKGQSTPCTGLHRVKEAVVTRSALTLDLDTPTAGLPDALALVLDHAAILHTTFQSTPDAPRYRLIVPLDREVSPEEYEAAATVMMNLLGASNFDPSSSEPERYMFKPAAEHPENFQWWQFEGSPASVELLLADVREDLSSKRPPKVGRNKRDPFEIEGVVGAFNRAYEDFQVLVEEYDLPYTPAGAERWHLVGSLGVAGMGEVPGRRGLFYSHHANDPCYGQTCTAFDVARLHLFGAMDDGKPADTPVNRLPSYGAMQDLATRDARVTAEVVGADFEQVLDDAASEDAWKVGLQTNRAGNLQDTPHNWRLLADNEPMVQGIRWNLMTMSYETTKDLPWRPIEPLGAVLRSDDYLSARMYLEETYRIKATSEKVQWLLHERASRNSFHAAAEWLRNLPEWDGQPRLETCLPGTADTPYNRMVARKCMVAAVARALEPGCKWDHTLILYGKEGLGKTHWIERMANGWHVSLGRVGDKDTLINLHRSWISTADEGGNMRKADAEALKEFLTRSEDTFRPPYDRQAQTFKRHCVIWGTTNDSIFLRRQEGNRRFLIVRCEDYVDFSQITPAYVEQVWAEALHLYQQGEVLLYLSPEEAALAAAERVDYTEEDGLVGPITAYLDTPVPMDWANFSIEARQEWLRDAASGFVKGDVLLTKVCTGQIWAEALNRRPHEHTRVNLLEIGKTMRELGWVPMHDQEYLPQYGKQTVYRRPTPEEELDDLL